MGIVCCAIMFLTACRGNGPRNLTELFAGTPEYELTSELLPVASENIRNPLFYVVR